MSDVPRVAVPSLAIGPLLGPSGAFPHRRSFKALVVHPAVNTGFDYAFGIASHLGGEVGYWLLPWCVSATSLWRNRPRASKPFFQW